MFIQFPHFLLLTHSKQIACVFVVSRLVNRLWGCEKSGAKRRYLLGSPCCDSTTGESAADSRSGLPTGSLPTATASPGGKKAHQSLTDIQRAHVHLLTPYTRTHTHRTHAHTLRTQAGTHPPTQPPSHTHTSATTLLRRRAQKHNQQPTAK